MTKLPFETVRWQPDDPSGARRRPGKVVLVEQTLLPRKEEDLHVESVDQMVDAIWRLAVRGAPAIGVAAAFGLLLDIQHGGYEDRADLLGRVRECAATLAKARPTAVNLFWALDRMTKRAGELAAADASADELLEGLFDEAFAIAAEDAAQCRRMGEFGAELIESGMTLLTHCNAGALATGGMGTALAPIYVAAEQGKELAVFADETRPLLQGARLTSWELNKAGVDVTLIVDGAAASVLGSGKVNAVFVGSDRIARNGDVCNKIGTYGVALAAARHGIPFYVVAPLTTFDPELDSGSLIPIEERPAEEVTQGFGSSTAPDGIAVYNPAFDVTPAELVTAIITDAGVLAKPSLAGVEELLRKAGRL